MHEGKGGMNAGCRDWAQTRTAVCVCVCVFGGREEEDKIPDYVKERQVAVIVHKLKQVKSTQHKKKEEKACDELRLPRLGTNSKSKQGQ